MPYGLHKASLPTASFVQKLVFNPCPHLSFAHTHSLTQTHTCPRHTHGAVDQAFSCHSRHLARTDVMTFPKLKAELEKSYTYNGKAPTVVDLEETADVKGWLEPHTKRVSEFKDYHWFEFNLDMVDGERHCIMSVKPFAASSDDNMVLVGRVLERVPPGQPLTAASRPLLYSNPRPKRGELGVEEYVDLLSATHNKAVEDSVTRWALMW